METVTGRVVWWNDDDGWGALTSDSASTEVFAHYSDVQMEGFRTLRSGQIVVFQLEHYATGQDRYFYRAQNIRPSSSE